MEKLPRNTSELDFTTIQVCEINREFNFHRQEKKKMKTFIRDNSLLIIYCTDSIFAGRVGQNEFNELLIDA